jgi:hypothetical protein
MQATSARSAEVGFDWEVLTVGLAAGLAEVGSATKRRRIDVVRIDNGVDRSSEREPSA